MLSIVGAYLDISYGLTHVVVQMTWSTIKFVQDDDEDKEEVKT